MKRNSKFLPLVLAASLVFCFIGSSCSPDDNGEINNTETGSRQDFYTAALAIISDNWEANYFSSIKMTVGESRMCIDG